MPTPRQHGGAPLAQIPLTTPGFKGLNTQSQGSLLGPEWATKLTNTVTDRNGRLAARQGWVSQTNTPHSSKFVSGVEYRQNDGTVELVATTDTEVVVSTDNGQTWSDVTGTASFTDGNWHLVNFDDEVYGFQSGQQPLRYDGTSASQVTDTSAPTSGAGQVAFGRLWGADADGVTLRWSDLLDGTSWTQDNNINLSNVWPGADTVVAIAQYNKNLVVFGNRNILIYSDPEGSTVGASPSNMVIVDTIPGIGCLSQQSVQNVNGDLWFISNSRELISLERSLLGQKSGSINTLSRNISDALRDSIDGQGELSRLRSAFSPKDRFYLLSLPAESSSGAGNEIGEVFVFDTRGFLEDGSARCMGRWEQMVPTAFWVRSNGDLLSALHTVTGEVGLYSQRRDNDNSYTLIYESGWIRLNQEGYLVILKRINGLFYIDRQTSANIKWVFDFSTVFDTKAVSFSDSGNLSEWGISEWGVAEWSGGISLMDKKAAGRGSGEFIKTGIDAVIDGSEFAIQQFDLFGKLGRLRA